MNPGPGGEENFELVALSGGLYSLRSCANGQTFHPVVGPVAEAETIHVGGTRLVERANALPAGERFVIWDVGLGAAANALAAIGALAVGYRRREDVTLVSFDRTAAALDFAVVNREALVYPRPYASLLQTLRATGQANVPLPASGAAVRWRMSLGDFPARLTDPDPLPAPHAVFFDPYSPTANPEMWTLELFSALHGRLRVEAPCLLTTYTRSTAVRVTLLLAGWRVGIGGATGAKDETTVAANDPTLLDRPLTRAWLEGRVHASTNAAPLRMGTMKTRGSICENDFARLRSLPQFV